MYLRDENNSIETVSLARDDGQMAARAVRTAAAAAVVLARGFVPLGVATGRRVCGDGPDGPSAEIRDARVDMRAFRRRAFGYSALRASGNRARRPRPSGIRVRAVGRRPPVTGLRNDYIEATSNRDFSFAQWRYRNQ